MTTLDDPAFARFDAWPETIEVVLESLTSLAMPIRRVLEIGCGSGETLVALARMFPDASFVGVDISEPSVKQARARVARVGLASRIDVRLGDYFSPPDAPLGPVDVIVATSVLHLVAHPDELIFGKIASDLAGDGRLVIMIPYRSASNLLLWAARWGLRRIRSAATDRAVLALARLIHPRAPVAVLEQRVSYAYQLPHRIDGKKMREAAHRHGLVLLDASKLRRTSAGQPRHRILVFGRSVVGPASDHRHGDDLTSTETVGK